MPWQSDIPKEHLSALVEKLLAGAPALSAARELCVAQENHAKLLALLEKVDPGISKRLHEIWKFPRSRAVHLWRAPVFEGLKASLTVREFSKETGGTVAGGVCTYPTTMKPARVHQVEIDAQGHLRAIVRLRKKRQTWIEDRLEEHPYSTDIELLVDLRHPEHLTEVYAGYIDGRQALSCLASMVLGKTVQLAKEPKLTPLDFNEAHVKDLAKTLKFTDALSLRGEDATGQVGTIEIEGKRKGLRLEPLDHEVEIVKRMEEQPSDSRSHGYTHRHDDDFEEYTEVMFRFRTKRAQVTFQRRTSRPAMKSVVNQLWTHATAPTE